MLNMKPFKIILKSLVYNIWNVDLSLKNYFLIKDKFPG
jgi:hypothetical protein